MATEAKRLTPNPNRTLEKPVPRLEDLQQKASNKEKSNKIWGQRINLGGKMMVRPRGSSPSNMRRQVKTPSESRIKKEALYHTGSRRIFDRNSGTGRPLNEMPKKSGAGGHNWGWPGIEVGVELASKEEMREIEREFNPTAPTADEEPQWRGEEEWAEGQDEYFGGEDEDLMEEWSGWEASIAGEERANRWPGYWEGLEGIRSLFGEELRDDEFRIDEPLLHSTWHPPTAFEATTGWRQETREESEEQRRVALSVGGPPKYAEVVAWGNKAAERATFEGVPVIPWGEEPERRNPETRGISNEGRIPASRAQLEERGKLPDNGPLGLEAERLSRRRLYESPASFINEDIKTEMWIDPGIAKRMGTEGNKSSAELEKTKHSEANSKRTADIGDTISIPS